MARHEKGSYELSEADQRDVFTLIREGRPLPEKYRFILFELLGLLRSLRADRTFRTVLAIAPDRTKVSRLVHPQSWQRLAESLLILLQVASQLNLGFQP